MFRQTSPPTTVRVPFPAETQSYPIRTVSVSRCIVETRLHIVAECPTAPTRSCKCLETGDTTVVEYLVRTCLSILYCNCNPFSSQLVTRGRFVTALGHFGVTDAKRLPHKALRPILQIVTYRFYATLARFRHKSLVSGRT